MLHKDAMSDFAACSVELPSVEAVHAARKRIAPHVLRTPLVRLNVPIEAEERVASMRQHKGGADNEKPLEIYLKLENLQHTGCFKARGAFSALLACDSNQVKSHGVLTSSAGNFGQVSSHRSPVHAVPVLSCSSSSCSLTHAPWSAHADVPLVLSIENFCSPLWTNDTEQSSKIFIQHLLTEHRRSPDLCSALISQYQVCSVFTSFLAGILLKVSLNSTSYVVCHGTTANITIHIMAFPGGSKHI